jgi:hypothetical protein
MVRRDDDQLDAVLFAWDALKHSARPTCAVCGTKVEEFTESDDHFMDRREFVAKCHGEREVVRLSADELRKGITFGFAFQNGTRRLP